MSIHFDAQFYMGPGKDPLVASLQYFNTHRLTFEDGGQYFLWANVSRLALPILYRNLMKTTGRSQRAYPLHLPRHLNWTVRTITSLET